MYLLILFLRFSSHCPLFSIALSYFFIQPTSCVCNHRFFPPDDKCGSTAMCPTCRPKKRSLPPRAIPYVFSTAMCRHRRFVRFLSKMSHPLPCAVPYSRVVRFLSKNESSTTMCHIGPSRCPIFVQKEVLHYHQVIHYYVPLFLTKNDHVPYRTVAWSEYCVVMLSHSR